MSPLAMTGIATAVLDLADEFPIGGAGVELAARAAVHADHANAACFGNPSEPGRIAAAVVPAGAHLQGDRQVHRLDRRLENARGMRFVAHQRRAGMAVDHLLHRAAEIDVDDPRPAIGVELGRLGHHPRLAAGELHRHRLLIGAALRHRHRLARLADHRLAGDHLGDDKPGSEPLDEAAERQIADARHRGEDDRIVEREQSRSKCSSITQICELA